MSDIRVGLIGFGYASQTFHAPLIAATDGVAIHAIASTNPAAAAKAVPTATIFDDPAVMIESDTVDLIVVATPHDSHADWAIRTLEAGKAVVVEKPFTLSLAEARSVAAVAARTGMLLSVFHNRRYASDFLTIRKAIADGLVGRVAHFETRFDRFRPVVRDRWRERAGPAGGLWFDLGPHLLDHSLNLFGIPQEVTADLATLRPGGASDDWAHVVLRYPDHRVILHASVLVAGGSARFTIHGDRGSVIKTLSDVQEAQVLSGIRPGSDAWGLDPDPLDWWDSDGLRQQVPACRGDQRGFYTDLVSAMTAGGPNPVPPAQAVAVVAHVEAARRSSDERRAVVPDLSQAERQAFAHSFAGIISAS